MLLSDPRVMINPSASNATMSTENVTYNATLTANGSFGNVDDLNCPKFTDDGDKIFVDFSLWVEGILCCLIAVPGFFGNIGSTFVLLQKGGFESRSVEFMLYLLSEFYSCSNLTYEAFDQGYKKPFDQSSF